MLKSFFNKIFGINKEIKSSRGSSNDFVEEFSDDFVEEKRLKEVDLIENCKKKVQARIEFYNQLKSIYNPLRDKQGSYTWNFMHSRNLNLRKVSLRYINEYQKKYKIKLPNLLIRVLTEIGSGGFINTNLINFENKINPPYVCMEKDFLDKCLDAKIDPNIIENGIGKFYDFEENSFSHSKIQKIYKSLNSNRDKYLVVLFGVGHDSSIVLNREDNMKIAVAGVPGITNLPFQIGNTEYDSPYFQYTEATLEGAICPLNQKWWNKMKKDIIKLNKENGS